MDLIQFFQFSILRIGGELKGWIAPVLIRSRPMSGVGPKRTLSREIIRSALTRGTDIFSRVGYVRKVPRTEVAALFDNFVGNCEQSCRNNEAECLRGLEIDN